MFGIDIGLPSLNPGDLAETLCDKLGLPEEIGDVAGLGVDLYTGNYAAAVEQGLDLFEDVPGVGQLHQQYVQAQSMGLFGGAPGGVGGQPAQDFILENITG